jgi:prevent-host-death family protein
MKTVNIHEAKTHLSRLLEGVANGESFVIAKSGKPVAKVIPILEKLPQRIGFMKGMGSVPDDFDTLFAEEIRSMFEDGPLFPDETSKRTK